MTEERSSTISRRDAPVSGGCNVNSPKNTFLGGGTLTLRALRENATCGSSARQYTQSYLDTIGIASFTYGRFEIRAKSPNRPEDYGPVACLLAAPRRQRQRRDRRDGAARLVWTRGRSTTPWYDQAFHKPYNIRLNFQVGGWLGASDARTRFPSERFTPGSVGAGGWDSRRPADEALRVPGLVTGRSY